MTTPPPSSTDPFSAAGKAPSPTRRRQRHLSAVALLTVGALLLGVGDWYLRNRELDRLLDAIELSEISIVDGQERLRRPEIRNHIDYQNAATDAASEVKDKALLVEEVRVMPWHRALGAAKAAYLRHSAAWSESFEDLAADRPTDSLSNIAPTFNAAHRAFRRALPPLAPSGPSKRIEDIFAE